MVRFSRERVELRGTLTLLKIEDDKHIVEKRIGNYSNGGVYIEKAGHPTVRAIMKL
jgi:hypothetical protein